MAIRYYIPQADLEGMSDDGLQQVIAEREDLPRQLELKIHRDETLRPGESWIEKESMGGPSKYRGLKSDVESTLGFARRILQELSKGV